jgi:hypothetical protein
MFYILVSGSTKSVKLRCGERRLNNEGRVGMMTLLGAEWRIISSLVASLWLTELISRGLTRDASSLALLALLTGGTLCSRTVPDSEVVGLPVYLPTFGEEDTPPVFAETDQSTDSLLDVSSFEGIISNNLRSSTRAENGFLIDDRVAMRREAMDAARGFKPKKEIRKLIVRSER